MAINIQRLYTMQAKFDEEVADAAGVTVTEVNTERGLALLVEIAEAANECRCFKFWSTQQGVLRGTLDDFKDELADVLHFALGVAYQYNMKPLDVREAWDSRQRYRHPLTISEKFATLMASAARFAGIADTANRSYLLPEVFGVFNLICEDFGISADELEEAYLKKHETNKQRQREGY